MILVDHRTGSKEFLQPFRDMLHAADSAEICNFLPADFMFEGNLPQGIGSFGIERKTIDEMVSKPNRDRLVDNQLPTMHAFGFDRIYLLVEGFWRPETDGRLRKYGRPSQMMYSSVDNFINSLSLTTGLRVIRSGSKEETVRMVVDLYNLVQKPWKNHRAHVGIYEPDLIHVKKPSLPQRWARDCKNVGPIKAIAAAREFKTAYDVAHADIATWERVTGSKVIATKVWKEIRGIKK